MFCVRNKFTIKKRNPLRHYLPRTDIPLCRRDLEGFRSMISNNKREIFALHSCWNRPNHTSRDEKFPNSSFVQTKIKFRQHDKVLAMFSAKKLNFRVDINSMIARCSDWLFRFSLSVSRLPLAFPMKVCPQKLLIHWRSEEMKNKWECGWANEWRHVVLKHVGWRWRRKKEC